MQPKKRVFSLRIDWRNTDQVGKFLGVLWAINVFGTLLGFAVQALLGSREWGAIPGAFLPVFLGSSIAFGFMWGACLISARRRQRNQE